MKKHEIIIKKYNANITVFFGDEEILSIETTHDNYPSPSYIPTIRDIWERCERTITLQDAREIKRAIYDNVFK